MIAAAILLFGAGGVHLSLNGRWLPLAGLLDPARTQIAHPGKISAALAKAAGPRRAGDRNGPARPAEPDPLVPATAAPNPPPATGSLGVPSVSIPSPGQNTDLTGALPRSNAKIDNSGSPAAQEPGRPRADLLPSTIGTLALRSAALAGNPAAEYEIGVRFSDGRGVPQNFEQAAFWLARAADQGLAPAQYRLASLREKGQGVKKDLSEARRLYSAAAQQGNGKAMHNLAVLYAVGLDGAPDYKIASEWFRKAADRGLADSQYNLAILCMRGLGVEQNLSEAYKWFALAAQQGDKDAGKKRDEVAARLDPESLAVARSAVQSWSAEPEPEKAIKVEPPGGDGDASSPPTPSAQNKPGRRPGNSGPA